MRAILPWLGFSTWGLLSGSAVLAQTAPAPDWTIPSAPARFVVALDQPDQSAALAWVNLDLPQPAWTNSPIRVFTDDGKAVGSELLWTAPGEPATILFDSSSGAKRYKIYPGSAWPPLPLPNHQAGVVLESRAGDGQTIDHLPDMLQAWNQSTTIYGRAIVQGLFEGGHRFGPQGNILEHFQGWFNVPSPEHLQLAAISTDASFVLVDGKEVVEWPGRHDFHPGLGGQFQGAVNLAAGVHSLEYYNAYVSNNEKRPLLCCLAAKGGALADWTMLMPESGFFLPTAPAHLVSYELESNAPGFSGTGAGHAPAYAITWTADGQSVIAPDVSDIGLISLQLACLPPTISLVTWTFDDGTTAQGPSVSHLFPRPGLRVVKLTVGDGEKSQTLSRTISVHPNWTELTTYPPQLTPAHQAEIVSRDFSAMSPSDLAGCVAVFATFRNPDGLLKMVPAIGAKIKDMNDADLVYVRDAGAFLARDDQAHFAEAGQLLLALVDRCSPGQPSPEMVKLGSESRLLLAQLTLKTSDQTDAVKSLLDGIKVDTLSGEEHRGYDILRGDLALATGDVARARQQYEALTGDPSGPDARSSVRRTAKIGQARAFLDRKDYDAAERALREVAMGAPIEKLSPDWALTQLRLYEEEGLPVVAYLDGKRLLPVITESNRSELLYRLTELAFQQGDPDLAGKTLAELLKNYPYSAEAAQAKEKWPAKE